MDLSILFQILRRRWHVVVLLVALFAPVSYQLLTTLQGGFEARGAVLLLPPASRDELGQLLPYNPYLKSEGSLVAAARALSEVATTSAVRDSVREAGLRGDYSVTNVEDLPVLNVVSASPKPTRAVETVNHVIDLTIGLVDEPAQDPDIDGIEAVAIHRPESVQALSAPRARLITVLIAALVVLVLTVTLLIEGARPRARGPDGEALVGTGPEGPRALLIFYVMALVFFPQRYDLGGFKLTGPMVIALLGAWVWLYGKALPVSGVARGVRSVQRALLVLGILVVTSYAVNQLRPLEEFESSGADRKTLALLSLFAVTLLAADGLRRVASVRRILGVMLAVVAVGGLIGIIQFVFGYDFEGLTRLTSRGGLPRAAGTAHHPIDFGVSCAAALPLGLHFFATATTRARRQWAGVATALVLGGVATSVSRSAAIGAVLAFVVVVSGRHGRLRWRTLLGATLAVAVLSVGIPGLMSAYGDLFSSAPESSSIQSRTSDYGPVIELWEEKPLIGRGYGTFDPIGFFVLDNSFLKMLIELGALGLLAWIGVLISGMLTARRVRHLPVDDSTSDLALAVLSMLCVLALSGFFYDVLFFQIGSGMMFLGLGCAAALHRLAAQQADGTTGSDVPSPASPVLQKV